MTIFWNILQLLPLLGGIALGYSMVLLPRVSESLKIVRLSWVLIYGGLIMAFHVEPFVGATPTGRFLAAPVAFLFGMSMAALTGLVGGLIGLAAGVSVLVVRSCIARSLKKNT